MRVRDEDGQALLLALAFLVFVGLVIGAMLSFASASVLATARLRDQRSYVYAADGATDAAIQVARANPGGRGIGAFGANPCMQTNSFTTTATTSDNTVATVTCTSLADPRDLDRTVQFTASVCSTPLVVATVLFHDGVVGSGSGTPAVDILSWTYTQGKVTC
jgi:hypothetical protein